MARLRERISTITGFAEGDVALGLECCVFVDGGKLGDYGTREGSEVIASKKVRGGM